MLGYIVLAITIFVGIYIYSLKNEEYQNKPIIFYHPIIKTNYCKLILLESLKKKSTKDIQQRLIEYNNYLLENHSCDDMLARLNIIHKNHELQTIFNLIKEF
jgi:hypothetical protein